MALKAFSPSNVKTDRQAGLWALVLVLLTVAAYLPALRGTFIWDDSVMVQDNQMLRTPQGLHDFWFTTKAVDPLPVTMSALWLQWHFWDGNPFGYHIVGLLAHILAALLLWRVLLRFTRHPRLAWLAAAAFALHPVCVASVAWISEQKNTLSIVFYLLSILCWMRRGARWHGLSLLLFLCALLGKGSTVMLPVVLLLIAWWQTERLTAKDFWKAAPFFLLAIAASLGTIWTQNHKAIAGEMAQELHMPGRIAAAGWAVWFYLWKALVPLNLCAIYPSWRVNAASIVAWLPDIVLTMVFVVCWRCRKSWGRQVLMGLGCFVVTLFPVMGFFTMYYLVFTRVADQWQYLALPAVLGLAICGGGFYFERAASKLRLPKLAGAVLAAGLLAALFYATWTRAAVYRNEMTLWTDTVQKNPKAWMAWNNLANALANAGDENSAIADYEKALEIHDIFPDAESNLGNALVARGELADAVLHLQRAVEEEPKMPRFHFNYGVGLAAQRRLPEAIAEYQKALELRPNMANVRNNLSGVYYDQKKYGEALEQAQLAIQINPVLPEPYLNAAKSLAAMDRVSEASAEFETFLHSRPDNAGVEFEYGTMLAMHGDITNALPHFRAVVRLKPDAAAGHSNLGSALARLKMFEEAVAEFRLATRLSPEDPQSENNLATALVEQGKTGESLEHYTTAIKLNPTDPEIRVNYSYALQKSGRRDEAIAQLREALRLQPGNPAIQQRLNEALR